MLTLMSSAQSNRSTQRKAEVFDSLTSSLLNELFQVSKRVLFVYKILILFEIHDISRNYDGFSSLPQSAHQTNKTKIASHFSFLLCVSSTDHSPLLFCRFFTYLTTQVSSISVFLRSLYIKKCSAINSNKKRKQMISNSQQLPPTQSLQFQSMETPQHRQIVLLQHHGIAQ